MTPTINVALEPCTYWGVCNVRGSHIPACRAAPILIPCPIPRSVTFTVRMGECVGCQRSRARARDGVIRHGERCPARPIRVSCSIGGETWEGSEPEFCEVPDGETFGLRPDDIEVITIMTRLLAICRERWGFASLLMTGGGAGSHPLAIQRDVVFSALADMARAEESIKTRVNTLAAIGISDVYMTEVRLKTPHDVAEAGLAAYVEHLVEQVGVLP